MSYPSSASARTTVAIWLVAAGLVACSTGGGASPTQPPEAGPVSSAPSAPAPPATLVPGARFVAPNGSDDGAGSESQPWRTLAHSLAALAPGETLYVRGGTYRERLTEVKLRPARPDARTQVMAFPGERPVVEGLLWIREPDHWTFAGINVTWDDDVDADKHMVKLIGGEGWEFKDAELWGARSFAAVLVTGEPADWRLSGNCIHDTKRANGDNEDQLIYANTGLEAGSGVIERNLLFDAPNGAGVKLGGSSRRSGGAARVAVRYNTVHNTAQNVLVAWESRDNVIARNILGKVAGKYGNIRGYQLEGEGNVARENVAFGSSRFLLNDRGYEGVKDGGGNRFPRNPEFDDVSGCEDFRPKDGVAKRYGHLAPEGRDDEGGGD